MITRSSIPAMGIACAALLIIRASDASAELTSGASQLTEAEAAQLTPQGLAGFRRLEQQAAAGELGADIRQIVVSPSYQGLASDGAMRIEVTRGDGSAVGFMLLRPQGGGDAQRPDHFILYPDDNVEREETQHIALILDATFPSSPWSGSPATHAPRWHLAGKAGEPVSRARLTVGILFVVASTFWGLVVLVGARSQTREVQIDHGAAAPTADLS